jgi:integrase
MGKINLTPQELFLEAEQLDILIQQWIDDSHARLDKVRDDGTRDTHTADGYADKVKLFRAWWRAMGPKSNWRLYQSDMLRFFRETLPGIVGQYDRPLSYNTRKDIHQRVGQMFKWALEHYRVDYDYSNWIPEAEGSAPLRQMIPLDYLHRLKEACYDTYKPVQYLAILAILMDTGMRRAECASLNIEDIIFHDDGSGTIMIRRAKRVKRRAVQGRAVVFSGQAGKYISAHIANRSCERGPLFVGADGHQHIKPDSIYRAILQLKRLSGLEDAFQGPHDLRRTFATTFAREHPGEGYGTLLSKQLGHANYEMTSRYTLTSTEDIRAAFVSPFSFLQEDDVSSRITGLPTAAQTTRFCKICDKQLEPNKHNLDRPKLHCSNDCQKEATRRAKEAKRRVGAGAGG